MDKGQRGSSWPILSQLATSPQLTAPITLFCRSWTVRSADFCVFPVANGEGSDGVNVHLPVSPCQLLGAIYTPWSMNGASETMDSDDETMINCRYPRLSPSSCVELLSNVLLCVTGCVTDTAILLRHPSSERQSTTRPRQHGIESRRQTKTSSR